MPRLIDLDAAVSVGDTNIMLVSQAGTARKATRAQVMASALQIANNLTDLTDVPAARINLGLGEIAVLDIGAGLEESAGTLQTTGGAPLPISGGQLTGIVRFTRAFTVTAAGTDQGGATALTAQLNVITGGAADTGVILPATGPVWIKNASGSTKKIYPPSGDNINALSANAAAVMTSGSSVMIETDNGTQWHTF